MAQRVGVMGGTFDPVHIGHLRAAEEAVELLCLDTLLFIPAASPPHKPGARVLAFEHRFRMLEMAIAGHPHFRLSDLENSLPGKSYTVVTLRKLHELLASPVELFFLVGMDAFLELDTWWNYKELFELAHMAVMRRPGYCEEQVGTFLGSRISTLYARDPGSDCYTHPSLLAVHYLRNTHLGVSSTGIRQAAASGKSIRYLVLPEVMSYIYEKNLYAGPLDSPVSI